VASKCVALGAPLAAVGAVSSAGTVAGLSGAGIASGLSAIGGSVAGGVAVVTIGPTLVVGALGFLVYKGWQFLEA